MKNTSELKERIKMTRKSNAENDKIKSVQDAKDYYLKYHKTDDELKRKDDKNLIRLTMWDMALKDAPLNLIKIKK